MARGKNKQKAPIVDRAVQAAGVAAQVWREARANVSAIAASAPWGKATGRSEITIPTDWVKRTELANDFASRNDAITFLLGLRRALVVGEGVKLRFVDDPEATKILQSFQRKIRLNERIGRMSDNRNRLGEAIPFKKFDNSRQFERIRLLNPLSVKYEMEDGVVAKITQTENGRQVGEWTGDDLNDFLILRNEADDWDERGKSALFAALGAMITYENYGKAENSTARRFANVIRLIKIGGELGNKIVNPNKADLNDAKKELDNLTNEQALVAPWYWNAETHGAEGVVLDVPTRMAAQVNRMAWALGINPFFLSGESALAGARVLIKATKFMITHDTQWVLEFIDWLFDEELRSQLGLPLDTEIECAFTGLSVDDEEWVSREDREMYTKGALSRRTWQKRRGLDPDVEDAYIASEPINLPPNMTVSELSNLVAVQSIAPEVAAQLLNLPIDQQEAVAAEAAAMGADNFTRSPRGQALLQAVAQRLGIDASDPPPSLSNKKTKTRKAEKPKA